MHGASTIIEFYSKTFLAPFKTEFQSNAFSALGQFSASDMFSSSQTFCISFENLSTIPELALATHGESSKALGTLNLGVFVSRHTRRSFVLPKLSKFVGDGFPPKDSLVSTKYFPSHWKPCRPLV